MLLAFIWTFPIPIDVLLVLIQLSLVKTCQWSTLDRHLCTLFNKPEIQSTCLSSSEGYIVFIQSHAKVDNFALFWRSSGGKSIQNRTTEVERKINLPIYDVDIIHRCSTKTKRRPQFCIFERLENLNWQPTCCCQQVTRPQRMYSELGQTNNLKQKEKIKVTSEQRGPKTWSGP